MMIKPTTWSHVQGRGFGFMGTLAGILQQGLLSGYYSLPALNSHSLYIASDFGGEHQESEYHTTSILIADMGIIGPWLRSKRLVRQSHLPNARRMAYKNLNDGYRRAALVPFLSAANLISGICVTLAVHKQLGLMFPPSIGGLINMHGLDPIWPPTAFEKLMRVTNLIGLFLALVSTPIQDAVWVSDQDEIADTEERYAGLSDALGIVSSHYLTHDLRFLRAGTTKWDENSNRDMEDLGSIPDLAAGAIADILTVHGCRTVHRPLDQKLSRKSAYIGQWLGYQSPALKKLVLTASPGDPGRISYGLLDLCEDPSKATVHVPDSYHRHNLKKC